MPTLTRDGQTLQYDVTGDGPAVLFLHNILCDRHVFDGPAQRLAQDHRVLRLDFRGHGESAAPTQPYTTDDLLADALAVLDAEGVTTATVIGLSIGASVALQLAVTHPQRVERLVLMGATAAPDTLLAKVKYQTLAMIGGTLGPQPWLMGLGVGPLFGKTSIAQRQAVVEGRRQRMLKLTKAGIRGAVLSWTTRPDLRADLPKLTMPTLVVAGAEDVSCPPAEGEAIAKAMPHAEFHLVPAAGHCMTEECPDACAEVIAQFLARV